MNAQDGRDRRDRLRALTADAARRSGAPAGSDGTDGPAAGALYVLPVAAAFPVEWLLLERHADGSDRWLAVPADTNPLRGPGDVWIGAEAPPGPLCLRCRFGVRLPEAALSTGRRTGQAAPETVAEALETLRAHEHGTLDPGPLAREAADDPEYQDWEASVLTPAAETIAGLAEAGDRVAPAEPPLRMPARAWIAAAAGLALLSIGLGAWNLALRGEISRLNGPILIGGSQEVVVGSPDRGPATLHLEQTDQRLLVFVVLSEEAANHARYRVDLTDGEGTTLWRSPVVETGAIPELNLVLPRQLFDESPTPTHLRVYAIEGDRAQLLAEVPLQIERTQDVP